MIQLGSSSTKESSNQSQFSFPIKIDTWTPEHWDQFRKIAGITSAGLEGPATAYPGEMYTPKTPEEQAYLTATTGIGGTRSDALERAFTGQSAYDINPEATEQFYRQSIEAPMVHNWQTRVLPQLKETYAGPGYYGAPRMEAERRSAQDLAIQLGSERAKYAYEDEKARREGLDAGAQRAVQYAVPQMGTAGTMARQIENERVLADLARWMGGEEVDGTYAPQYNPFIQLAFQALGFNPYAVGQVSSGTGSSTAGGSSWGLGIKL